MDLGVDLSLYVVLGLVLVAFAAGFISSIAGAGGMIVLPMLLWAGLPPLNALATNKFQSVFGTLSSTINFFQKGQINFKELRLALLCAFIGALLGTWGVQAIDAALLKAAIPYALILVAVYMLFSPSIADVDTPAKLSRGAFDVSVAGGIGFYGGLFGPGMGSFYAVAFAGLRGNNMRKATAHTKPLVLITNFTSMVVFMLGGQLVWGLAIIMAL
ncbi:MAG: TSUP family transporter, partial [Cellvibrionaceae bacterium]|nr:TSUP family transporter [Cellvibrionaceae bacterium]